MTAPALAFDTDNGRYYRHPGNAREVPSITNIKGLKHIDLKNFAAKKAAAYAAARREVLATLEQGEVYSLVRNAVWEREPNSPSEIGDTVHKWIERHVAGDEPDQQEEIDKAYVTSRNCYKSFLDWESAYRERYGLEYVESEFTVWSDSHDYAGTGDLIFQLGNRLVLADTKTGNAVYPDTAMQLAALANADYILREDGTQEPIPGIEAYGILHLRPTYACLVPVFHVDEWFKAFLGLREMFRVNVEFKDNTLGHAARVNSPR